MRGPRPRHDPGRVLVDLAVAIPDGAEAISDIAVLGDQPALFGPVASGQHVLAAAGCSRRAPVRRGGGCAGAGLGVAWAQRAETTGHAFGRSPVAGGPGIAALVIDLDAHVLVCHSEGVRGSNVLLLTELPRSSLVSLDVERVVESYLPRP